MVARPAVVQGRRAARTLPGRSQPARLLHTHQPLYACQGIQQHFVWFDHQRIQHPHAPLAVWGRNRGLRPFFAVRVNKRRAAGAACEATAQASARAWLAALCWLAALRSLRMCPCPGSSALHVGCIAALPEPGLLLGRCPCCVVGSSVICVRLRRLAIGVVVSAFHWGLSLHLPPLRLGELPFASAPLLPGHHP